jgi:hypothetical protein
MDCNTARLLSEFHRPRAGDLESADQASLERHLLTCPDCGPLHQAERRLDEAFARAMTRVDVPDRLHEHLLARLEVDRIDRARNRLGHFVRAGLAAAVLLLLIFGGWAFWRNYREHQRTRLNVPDIVEAEKNRSRLRTSLTLEQAEADYRARGQKITLSSEVRLPNDLNYNFLRAETVAPLPGVVGVQVPCLIFADKDLGRYAEVYILSAHQFDFSNVPPSVNDAYQGWKVEFVIVKHAAGQLAYVAVYNGDNLDWLRQDQT